MFLPIGDEPNPPKPQWVTRILIAINIAVYLFITMPLEGRPVTAEDRRDPAVREQIDEMWEASREMALRSGISRARWETALDHYALFTFRFGYKPGAPNLLALLFCMFLHGGLLHLAGNMLYLWIFGDNVEARLGRGGYLVAYLATGVAATLSFALLDTDSMTPLVGASGAISGVLGFYFAWFPYNRVRVLIFFFFITIVYVPAIFVLGFYLLVDNLLPLLATRTHPALGGVAHAAHLGGFVAGMLAGYALRNRLRVSVRRPPPPQRTGWHPPAMRHVRARPVDDPGAAFENAVRAGNMEEAAHAFSRVARENVAPPAPTAVFDLARWLYENDFTGDAAAVFRYYIRAYVRGDDLDRVHLGLGTLLARRLGQPAAAREHLLAAIDIAGPTSPIAERAREELARLA